MYPSTSVYLHIDDLTGKERIEFENMVQDYKPVDKRKYQ
ncbi:hypothetical protein BAMO111457_14510 [Bacillus mobilis]